MHICIKTVVSLLVNLVVSFLPAVFDPLCAELSFAGVPFASHNMRMRIRKDTKLSDRLRQITQRLNGFLTR